MKYFIITFILFLSACSNKTGNSKQTKKKNCSCGTKPILNNSVNCDTTLFENGSKLYWQFTCDSSWLTFENKNGLKYVMTSFEKKLIELTGRLSYQFVKEYKTTLLFENRQASGGGFPINFELIDKKNGKVIEAFGTIIFYSDMASNNYVLYLSTDSMDTLTYYHIDTRTKYTFSIPPGRLKKTIMESNEMFPEYLFEEPKTENNLLTVKYKYLVSDEPEKWNKDSVIIDLTKIIKQ